LGAGLRSVINCKLAVNQCQTHILVLDPAHGSGRSGELVPGVDRGLPGENVGRSRLKSFLWGFSKRIAMPRSIARPDPSVPPVAESDSRMGNDENRVSGNGGPVTSVITKVKPKTKRPNLYRVLILNDDYTPMEFVVHVLEKFFQKDVEAATKIMLHVHHHGIGECGVFTYEIAETKVTQVMDFARKHQHPLQCVMEKK
jgi:ATP-dependent Clp protease adaptor protein ClpS